MKIIFIALVSIHGLIHLFGFLKAFKISEFEAIVQPVSKIYGIFWLVASLFFIACATMLIKDYSQWWLASLVALVLSQLLVFNYWSDAKFGMIANVIILVPTILAYAQHSFYNKIDNERIAMNSPSFHDVTDSVSINDLSDLPPVIQKWLMISDVLGKPKIRNVYLKQDLLLKLKPDQGSWSSGAAEQYFLTDPPSFNWHINTEMNSLIKVVGRDKLEKGKGEMLIKLFSFIPVAKAKGNKQVDEATLQRYLAEIVWFPSVATSDYIEWEPLDENSARATLSYEGTTGTGVFFFDENGNFKKFVAQRFRDINDAYRSKWVVTALNHSRFDDTIIPSECVVSWEIDGQLWTWLKLNITHLEYNVTHIPVTKLSE